MPCRPNILVIDDDNDMNMLLKDFLSRQGYTVTLATSGPMALNLLNSFIPEKGPDLVISDVVMNSMDGIELTKHLLKARPGLDVVLMSGYGSREIEKEALAAGARAFLYKPFQLSHISKIVREHLHRKPNGGAQ